MRSVLVLILLVGCSASKEDNGGTSLGAPRDSGGSTTDGGLSVEDGFTADTPSSDAVVGSDCAEENKQIYVVSQENDLYRFAPATLTITKVGTLDCPAGSATPFSMAVDRKGTAWVLYSDGSLWKVSTKDASCASTSFVKNQEGFLTFGMGYVSDTPGSTSETLYVAEYGGKGLGKVDSSLKLSFVGPYGAGGGAAELTGRGDARIFGFFDSNFTLPVRIAELDKSTGAIKTMKNQPSLSVGSGWAFAHWGGSYWLFTAPSGSSQITEYDFDKDTSKVVKTDLGFVIVGAGVSTCAPTERPK
ncbi:MAG: hypothetical protein ACXWUG_08135 [Polyangiales bacterium]